MTLFTGSGVALVTPFKENGDIDYDGFANLLDFHLEHKTDALIIAGTSGEASTMTDEEQRDLVKFAVDRVAGRKPVIAGAGSNDTRHGINLSKMCEEVGADALLQVTPYYNKTTQKGLLAHFTAIADAVDIPIILYNVPGRTGMSISPEVCAELAENPKFVGIKDATGDLSYTGKVSSMCGEKFDIYSGNDDVILPLMSLGGKGVISVWANAFPDEVHDMCEAFSNGDIKKATDIQVGFKNLIDLFFVETNPIPIKAAMEIMGLCSSKVRLPLVEAEKATFDKLRTELKRLGVI